MELCTTLYFREGSSDKVYQAGIRPKGGGYMVHFAYGRRGSTLNTGSKTPQPVEYQIAKGIYDKLVRDKVAKGYRPGQDNASYTETHSSRQESGIRCQLLNPIDVGDLPQLIASSDYCMQEKMDGRRLLLQKQDGSIQGIIDLV